MPPKFVWEEIDHPELYSRAYRVCLVSSDRQTMFWYQFCISEQNLFTSGFDQYLAEMKHRAEMMVLSKCDEYEEMGPDALQAPQVEGAHT